MTAHAKLKDEAHQMINTCLSCRRRACFEDMGASGCEYHTRYASNTRGNPRIVKTLIQHSVGYRPKEDRL